MALQSSSSTATRFGDGYNSNLRQSAAITGRRGDSLSSFSSSLSLVKLGSQEVEDCLQTSLSIVAIRLYTVLFVVVDCEVKPHDVHHRWHRIMCCHQLDPTPDASLPLPFLAMFVVEQSNHSKRKTSWILPILRNSSTPTSN